MKEAVEEVLWRCQHELLLSIYKITYHLVDPYNVSYHEALANATVHPNASNLYPNESYHTEDWGAHDPNIWPEDWDPNWLAASTEDPNHHHHRLVSEISLCDDCNFTSDEFDILFAAGVCNPSDFSTYMPLIYVMYSVIFLVALLGNALVLHTITANRKMHTVTNLFIANLAVGDLLITVFCVPFSVASIIVLQYWPFGEALCVFVNYSQAVSIFVSAYTLVAISLDRYLAIIYPLRPRMTRCQAKVIIAGVWAMALLTTLPIPLVSGLDPTEIRIYQHYGYQVCKERWANEELQRYYTMVLMVLQYFIPLFVIVFTYSRIACKVWGCGAVMSPGHSRHLHHQVTQAGDPNRNLLRKNTGDHSPAKMIRMTLTVVMVYSLCWLPFNTLMVILDFTETAGFWPHTHHIWVLFHWLAMSHACYNPLILCWMNTKFKQGYLRALHRLLPCCRPRFSHYLLELRQSSGLQRAHTYSSAFGSTRGASRTQRHSPTMERIGQNGRDILHVDGRTEVCCINSHTAHVLLPTHTHNHHHSHYTQEGESKL